MTHDLAFLHTSPVHVPNFAALVRDRNPDLRVRHEVDEQLLIDARRTGADEPSLRARIEGAMTNAADTGASIVVCTCSSIGGVAERMATGGRFVATRIDRAMADIAVRDGRAILVVAALESTLPPTLRLIAESAAAAGRMPVVRTCLVEPDGWTRFLAGDIAGYVDAIVTATERAGDEGLVMLAQASMAPAAARLAGPDRLVLSSPAPGVDAAIAQVLARSSA